LLFGHTGYAAANKGTNAPRPKKEGAIAYPQRSQKAPDLRTAACEAQQLADTKPNSYQSE
jgi:hypothetical protein